MTINWDYVSIAVAGTSAALSLYIGLFIKIRDNIDEFMNDLARQGRWQSAAAVLNLLSVAFLVISVVLRTCPA